ncbi:MAG: type VI secretion system baseplate subunit TssK [Phycisphaerales bacterium]
MHDLPVHWEDGLYLDPHHFQQMQRHIDSRFIGERSLLAPFAYGVIDLAIDESRLRGARRIRLERLDAVMPSGRRVRLEAANIEERVLDESVLQKHPSFRVDLALPLWQPRRANAYRPVPRSAGDSAPGAVRGVADWDRRVFRVEGLPDVADENELDNPRHLDVRKWNATLLFEDEPDNGCERLPLIRIRRETASEGTVPRLDPAFVGPTMRLAGSNALCDRVARVSAALAEETESLRSALHSAGFNPATAQRVDLLALSMRLSILGSRAARISALTMSSATSPFVMYVELADLRRALFGLDPEVAAPLLSGAAQHDSDYRHDDPAIAFQRLEADILRLVRGKVIEPVRISLLRTSDGWFEAGDGDAVPARANVDGDIYLGVASAESERAVEAWVTDGDKLKLTSRDIARRQREYAELISGIPIQPLTDGVPGLRRRDEHGVTIHYFRLACRPAEVAHIPSHDLQTVLDQANGIAWIPAVHKPAGSSGVPKDDRVRFALYRIPRERSGS